MWPKGPQNTLKLKGRDGGHILNVEENQRRKGENLKKGLRD